MSAPATTQPEPPDEQAALAEVIRNGGLISDDARFALTSGIRNGTLSRRQRELLVELVYKADTMARFDRSASGTPLRGAYRALLAAVTPDVTP